ncbi:uncharacterized protein LOC144166727 [Haemaphysalis longicornis]
MADKQLVIAAILLVGFAIVLTTKVDESSSDSSMDDIEYEEDGPQVEFCYVNETDQRNRILGCVLNTTEEECPDCPKLLQYQQSANISLQDLGNALCNHTNELFYNVSKFQPTVQLRQYEDYPDLNLTWAFGAREKEILPGEKSL